MRKRGRGYGNPEGAPGYLKYREPIVRIYLSIISVLPTKAIMIKGIEDNEERKTIRIRLRSVAEHTF